MTAVVGRATRADEAHGLVIAAAPLAVAMVLCGCVVLSFLRKRGVAIAPEAILVVASVAFAAYGPVLLWMGGEVRKRWIWVVALWGVTFPVWGFLVGVLLFWMASFVGWPQSPLTGLVLGKATRSRQVGVAVALAVLPAWLGAVIAVAIGDAIGLPSLISSETTFPRAVALWGSS